MGQTPPSSRQLLVLRLVSLISPPPGSSALVRVRGFLLLAAIVIVLMAIGFGLAKLIALPFGGVGTFLGIVLGLVIVVAILGLLTLFGRRRQAKAQAAARSG
jgi:hypothetical protein